MNTNMNTETNQPPRITYVAVLLAFLSMDTPYADYDAEHYGSMMVETWMAIQNTVEVIA